MAMNAYLHLALCLLLFQTASPVKVSRSFHWNWREEQYLGYTTSSLTDTKVSQADRAALARAIEKQIGPPDKADPQMHSESQVAKAVLDTRVKMINLSQSGSPQVVAQFDGFCSGDGNCSLWFFQKTPRGYKLLIDAIGQGFTIQKSSTNGYRDLVVAMHSSATDQWLKVYHYARGRYWRSACYDADWAPLENGVIHQLKEPRVTADSCDGN